MTREDLQARTAREQAEEIRQLLDHVIVQLRTSVEVLGDARGKALFETAAEVLGGLDRAFSHYIDKSERPWRKHD